MIRSLPAVFLLLAGLVGVGSARAQTAPLPTTWQVNGNGYTGLLILEQVDGTTHEVRATLLGTPARGYLIGRHLVLHRYPQGSTQLWEGWLLETSLGAPGLASYDGQLIVAGTISQSGTGRDGLYPWYAVSQGGGQPPPPPSTANLLVNGDFELGPRQFNVSSGIPGWTVTREVIDMVTTYWQQVQGEVSIDLAGSPGNGAIAQTFATRPGQLYEVSFLMAGNAASGVPIKEMRVSAAGQSETFQADIRGKSTQNMGWTRQTWRFRATQASTTLTFENVGPERLYGMALDDVRVVAR